MTLQRRATLSGREAAYATEMGLLAIPTLGCTVVGVGSAVMALDDSAAHGSMHPIDLTLIGMGGLTASLLVKRASQARGSAAGAAVGTLGTIASVIPGAIASKDMLFSSVTAVSHHEAVALITTGVAVSFGARINTANKHSRGL